VSNWNNFINAVSSGVAASVLAAEGVRARPVLHGGVDDWQDRGHQLTAFRRCGSG